MIDRTDCIGYDPVDCERYVNCEECEYHEQEEKEMNEDYWVFTFGCGRDEYGDRAGKAVRVFATSHGEAREKMVGRYGTKWAFQYSAEEWEKFESDPSRFWDMEEVVEEII